MRMVIFSLLGLSKFKVGDLGLNVFLFHIGSSKNSMFIVVYCNI